MISRGATRITGKLEDDEDEYQAFKKRQKMLRSVANMRKSIMGSALSFKSECYGQGRNLTSLSDLIANEYV